MRRTSLALLLFLLNLTFIYSAGYNREIIAPGKTLSVDFKDAELIDVVRIIARKFDINMIAGESIKGKVTVSFREIPVDDALESILKINGFAYIKDGNIVRIIELKNEPVSDKKSETAATEKEIFKTYTLKNSDAAAAAENVKKIIKNGEKMIVDSYNNKFSAVVTENEGYLVDRFIEEFDKAKAKDEEEERTEIFRVKYMSVDELAKIISDINLKFTGSIRVNSELKSLVVRGGKSEIEKLKKIVAKFDVEPLQVLIEARIVELSDEGIKDTGVYWKYADPRASGNGNNYQMGVGNKELANGSKDGLDLKVGLLNIDNFELYFSNLLTTTNSNLLSNPTITTMSGMKAQINIGEKLRYRLNVKTEDSSTTTADTTEEEMVEIPTGIMLEVTPVIYEDGKIKMEIMQNIEDIVGYTSDNLPKTATRSATTNVIADNGNTIIIGGLIKEDEVIGSTSVPVLGDIPVIGNLFKSKNKTKRKKNLMIFITPKILKTREFWQNISTEELATVPKTKEELAKERYTEDINSSKGLIRAYMEAGMDDHAKGEAEKAKNITIRQEEIEKLESEIKEVK